MRIFILLTFIAVIILSCTESTPPVSVVAPPAALQTGDILFQQTRSGQGLAIQLATQSRYTHCGILLRINDQWQVLEAVQPVRYTPLAGWIARGDEKQVAVRRINPDSASLPDDINERLIKAGQPLLGKAYDIYFNWDDTRIYCSELVWKLYQQTTGIELCKLRPLSGYELNHPEIKKIMRQRYDNRIPLNEPMTAPADILNSTKLLPVSYVPQ
jgi:uncharacterized protein YycO